MPKKIQKTLQDYLFKIKQPNQRTYFSSKNWILSACKHPKTLSFAIGRNSTEADISAKLSDIDRFLADNFKSLYGKDDVDEEAETITAESPRFGDPVPRPRSSDRFFVSPGTTSGSLVEESRSTTTSTIAESDAVRVPDQCVAVLAHSPNPQADFRRSMSEVVEARLRRDQLVDWGFMEEILLCFLDLNDERSHRFVLSAFVDLVVDLRRREANGGALERQRRSREGKLSNKPQILGQSNVRDLSS